MILKLRLLAAIDDFQTAFDWLREGGPKIGVDSHRLVLGQSFPLVLQKKVLTCVDVGGSSAGANLAAVLSLRLTRRKEPVLPRLVVLDSPALDDRFDLYPSMAADHPLAHYQCVSRSYPPILDTDLRNHPGSSTAPMRT